jgi:hypothetical protein
MDEYLDRFKRDALPKIRESAYVAVVAPGEPDAKVCLEVGAAILLDKPFFIIAEPGRAISDHLRRVADEVIVVDMNTDAGKQEAMARIAAFTARFDG